MEAASLAPSAAQTLLTALRCPDFKAMSSIFNYKSHLGELQNTVSTYKAVLKDAETKQELSNHVLNYIQKLKDVVYDADDLFDKVLTIGEKKQLMQDGEICERVCLIFSRFNPLVAFKMSKRVKKIKKKLEGIANDHSKFGFRVDSQSIRKRREETCSYVYEGNIVGRKYDVEKIVGILLDSNVQLESQQDVFLLSIVGIGGLGKTTLAQLLFNDKRVKHTFSKRLWTCVSDHDQEKSGVYWILRKILTSATGVEHEGLPMEEVQKQLRRELASNRYLLVLDDVWTENRSHWLDFVGYLLGGQRGSWIVVTTCSEETAKVIGSNSVHKLQGLSEEDSWNLFMKMAFGLEQTNPPDDALVAIGEKIVKGCAGVPLALRVVGSLLYGQDKSKWASVQTMRLAEIREYSDVTLLGSGHFSSPGSGHNSGYISMGDDISGHLFWQQPSRGRSKYSPVPCPGTSPGPISRVQSGSVTPIHLRAAGTGSEAHGSWGDDGKHSHRLPLPPLSIPNPSPFSRWNSAATSPSVPRSLTREENLPRPTSRCKKGRLLSRGTFGQVYLGFNSEIGKMCAMKEVTLFPNDPKSNESAKQLQQEIAFLSRLRHPNIVQYFGSETVGDKLFIYMEYVSGGSSIYKLLQEYGQLGELAIRSYTQQPLSGLAFLHGKNIVHRDIKGANILVDTNGRVKLADFGTVKHITVQSRPLSFIGSPHWMAPEVIKNSSDCNPAVDIWSLGCTVLEMATTKPPWSQYNGVAAMFKIRNSNDLPAIPDHLSDEGKDFVRLCLQRNPQPRHTAAQLLEHPFVNSTGFLERPSPSVEVDDILNGLSTLGAGLGTNISSLDFEGPAVHSSSVSPTRPHSSEYHIPRNISCPVSPIGSPLLHPRSPQHLSGMMSPCPTSSSCTTSGSSTPLMGDCGAIPIHQSLYMPECFGALPKSPISVIPNVPCYHDPSPNKLRELHSGPYTLATLVSSESGTYKNQVEREIPCQVGDPFKGRTILGDRLTQELIWKLAQKNPSVEFSPVRHCLIRPMISIHHGRPKKS